jgi:hypothetical protein
MKNDDQQEPKLPRPTEIDPESLNPVMYELMRQSAAKIFGGELPPTDERKLPADLPVPVLDAVLGLRWYCGFFIETVESSDLPTKAKAHLLGRGVRKFLDAEAELLGPA